MEKLNQMPIIDRKEQQKFSEIELDLALSHIDEQKGNLQIFMKGMLDRICKKCPELDRDKAAGWSANLIDRISKSVDDPNDQRIPLAPAGFFVGTKKKITGPGNSVAFVYKA